MSILKGFFDNFKELVMKICQKVGIFHFQSQFRRPKNDINFWKNGFALKIVLEEQLLKSV